MGRQKQRVASELKLREEARTPPDQIGILLKKNKASGRRRIISAWQHGGGARMRAVLLLFRALAELRANRTSLTVYDGCITDSVVA